MKTLLLVGVLALASVAGAADFWASGYTNTVITVPEGEVETIGSVNMLDGAMVEKRGKGTLVLPLKHIIQEKAFRMKVLEGKVQLEEGTVPAVETPTEILNRAYFHLDASKPGSIVEATGGDGNKYVETWHDVRETKTVEPFDYPFASGRCYDKNNTGMNFPTKVVSEVDGRTAVYCGGWGSGAVLLYSEEKSYYEVFSVHRITSATYGFLYYSPGYTGMGAPSFHPSSSSIPVGSSGYAILAYNGGAQPDARWWMDGREIDAYQTPAQSGLHVWGFHLLGLALPVYGTTLYSTSSLKERNGGDEYLETILFTDRLTAIEHEKVERYLNDRYGKTFAATTDYTFDVVGEGTVDFGTVNPAKVKVNGATTTARPAMGVHTVDYVVGTANDLTLSDIPAGEANATILKRDAAVEVVAGEVLSSTNGNVGAAVVVSFGSADEIVKEGKQTVRVRGIPEGTSKLKVKGGILTLAPARSEPVAPEVYAVISNKDFAVAQKQGWHAMRGKTDVAAGWWGGYESVGGVSDFWAQIHTHDYTKTDSDNNWTGPGWQTVPLFYYGIIRGRSWLETEIDVPEDGDYELFFRFAPTSSDYLSRLDVLIGPDDAHLTEVGHVFELEDNKRSGKTYAFADCRYTLADLKKGKQLLRFEGATCPGTDADVKASSFFTYPSLRKIVAKTRVIPFPGGDFEGLATNVAVFANASPKPVKFIESNMVLDDWTCVQPEGVYAIGPVLRGSTSYDSAQEAFGYYAYKLDRGDRSSVQMLLGNKDGYAEKTAFVPAGTWKLMLDCIAFHRTNSMGPAGRGKNFADVGVSAMVTVGDAVTQLGDIMLTKDDYGKLPAFDATFGTSFTVPEGGANVTLRLQGVNDNGGINIDNLRLVAQSAGAANLIANGEFSNATVWQTDTSAYQADTPFRSVDVGLSCGVGPSVSEWRGCSPHYDGKMSGSFCSIIDCATIYQSVTFPSAGRYRLVYYTRGRNHHENKPVEIAYSQNRLLAYIAKDGVTNSIDVALADTTNWVQHVAVFTVRTAGTYDFGFAGLNRPTVDMAFGDADSGGRDKMAFLDGVSVVKLDTDVGPENEVFVPSDLKISVSDGARLNLGFEGTLEVDSVRHGGHVYRGLISAETHPEFVVGSGALNATGPVLGMCIILR